MNNYYLFTASFNHTTMVGPWDTRNCSTRCNHTHFIVSDNSYYAPNQSKMLAFHIASASASTFTYTL